MKTRTWTAGENTGDMIEWLVPLDGYNRKTAVETPKPQKPAIKQAGEQKYLGTIVHFYFGKGFGFVSVPGRDKDAFLHISELLLSGIDRVTRGDKIRFDLRIDERSGRELAVNISVAL